MPGRWPPSTVFAILAAFAAAGLPTQMAAAQPRSPHAAADDRPPRAEPPRQWPQAILDEFFPDARTVLEGERPAARFTDPGAVPTATPMAPEGMPAATPATGFAWSQHIAAETLEDEVKRISQAVAAIVRTPVEFKGGSYQDGRLHFTMLAVLFEVAAEYDGEVRWQRDAATLRDLFARAARNCKVGTDASFQEARLRSEDLQSIVRGSRVDGPPPEPDLVWGELVDRPPLMQRMEVAFLENLTPWLSSEASFARNRDRIRDEAQLLTVLGEVITREGFEFFDDDTYQQYASTLREAAREIAEAVPLRQYQKARRAAASVTKACSDCHDGYRS